MKNRPVGDAAVASSIFYENRDIAYITDSRGESMIIIRKGKVRDGIYNGSS
ncbi:MAG: hypothetical protein LUI39_11680 [Lachnospiraceae bacterium]|nr:hypothetical protein [Lachnospiraceae bacterium]